MKKVEVKSKGYIFSRYPVNCKECPMFSQVPYTCHNERGYEERCMMGYMANKDMRYFSGEVLFDGCNLENDSLISLMGADGKERQEVYKQFTRPNLKIVHCIDCKHNKNGVCEKHSARFQGIPYGIVYYVNDSGYCDKGET